MTRTASPQEDALVQELGTTFEEYLRSTGKAFVQEVTESSIKAGISTKYLPFVFWAIFEDYKNWPPMSNLDREMLVNLMRITSETGSTPKYSLALNIPQDQLTAFHETVDSVIAHMGAWSRQAFAGLFKTWMSLLKRLAPKVPKATGGQVPASASMSWLHKAFRELLSMRQGWFSLPMLLLNVVSQFPAPR